MNVPKIKSYEEQAIDTVVSVINRAKEMLGMRLSLKQLASEYSTTVRALFSADTKHTRGDGIGPQTGSLHAWEPHPPSLKSFGCMTVPNPLPTEPTVPVGTRGMTVIRDFATNVKLSLKPIQPPYAITSEKFINETIEHHWKLGQTFKYFVRYMGGSRNEVSQYYYFEAIFSQPTVAYPIPQATVSVFFTLQDKHIDPPEKRGVPLMWFRIEGHHTDHDMRYVALPADWILAVLQMKIKLFQRIEAIRMF